MMNPAAQMRRLRPSGGALTTVDALTLRISRLLRLPFAYIFVIAVAAVWIPVAFNQSAQGSPGVGALLLAALLLGFAAFAATELLMAVTPLHYLINRGSTLVWLTGRVIHSERSHDPDRATPAGYHRWESPHLAWVQLLDFLSGLGGKNHRQEVFDLSAAEVTAQIGAVSELLMSSRSRIDLHEGLGVMPIADRTSDDIEGDDRPQIEVSSQRVRIALNELQAILENRWRRTGQLLTLSTAFVLSLIAQATTGPNMPHRVSDLLLVAIAGVPIAWVFASALTLLRKVAERY
jgi:hypothetical protein